MWPLASSVLRSAWETAKRFPGPLLAAVVTTALLIDAQHQNFRGKDPLMSVLAAVLGIPLGTALTLLAERPPRFLARVPARPALSFLITVVLTSLYAAALHAVRDQGESYILRYAQLSVAAHLAVAFAPFLGKSKTKDDESRTTRGVWQLGRRLFLRLPLSAVYALVVFGGLALALAAVVHLFGVRVDEGRYFEIWAVCAFILQTWIFLAGVPTDFDALTDDETYPRGLRIFAQFVLLPLLGLYLIILYAYLGKILLSGTLPNGWVGWLVSAAGGFGMLALLLLFPAREGPTGRFVRGVELGFHLAILPLLGLLFVSIGVRLGAYGITERRYFLLILGVWLAAASLYRLRWGRRTLTWIPASLCLVALATSFGPWGALSVSRESQSARLTALLQKTQRISGPPADGKPALSVDEREISRILDYLVEVHGTQALERWPGPMLSTSTSFAFMHARDLTYVERYGGGQDTLSFYGEQVVPLQVSGYDWFVPFQLYEHSNTPPASSPFTLRLLQSAGAIEVSDKSGTVAQIALAPLIARLEKDAPLGRGSSGPMLHSVDSGQLRFHLVLTHLHADRSGDGWAIVSCGGSLLIGELPHP